MKIVVVGASGMVGRNLVDGLKNSDHQILAPGKAELNLLNYQQTLQYLKNSRAELIVHCAGKVGGIQANIANPVSFLVDNADISKNIILAARECEIKKMINLGSSCMYPRNAENPLTEDLILTGELEPTNEGYALAKIYAQRLCEYISKEDPSYQYKTLVPCNLYGPYDKFDPKHSHLLPAIIYKIDKAIQQDHAPVEIWGTGEARREFMFVGDLINCITRAIDNFESLPKLMNVGLGIDYSVKEYYEAVAGVMGYRGQFVYDKTKPVGMMRKLVSVDRAKNWGWQSSVSLSAGIEATVNYYKTLPEI